jgi:hypothetical protein
MLTILLLLTVTNTGLQLVAGWIKYYDYLA